MPQTVLSLLRMFPGGGPSLAWECLPESTGVSACGGWGGTVTAVIFCCECVQQCVNWDGSVRL